MQTLTALNARYRNPQGVAMFYLLGWLAGCDGRIDEDEAAILDKFGFTLLNDAEAVSVFLPLIQRADSADIVTACRLVKRNVDPVKAHLLFELMLAMAMADGVFSVGENHIVRFFADVLGLSRQRFETSFQTVTGRAPQPPSDLSKASWWQDRDRQRRDREAQARQRREQEQRNQSGPGQRSSSKGQGKTSTPPPAGSGSRRAEALRHLGLGNDATIEEIKNAYKRLAKVHHPDRFEGLSAEIIEAANLSFRRIREAYEYLT